MTFERYSEQLLRWPRTGRHILASYDQATIVVYQAFADDIADYALANQRFGGRFSFGRMSWIKPNFLWMMFRSGWARKQGQERVLAVHLSRRFFEELLASAVLSSFGAARYAGVEEWRRAVVASDVRLQWDPDHDPAGAKQARRALQLGLRGEALQRYGTIEVRKIVDMTAFVEEQRSKAIDTLRLPTEDVYKLADADVRARLGIDD